MSSDRYRAPAEPDQDAYEDAWYRALKAKASQRFRDPKQDQAEALPSEPAAKTAESDAEPGAS